MTSVDNSASNVDPTVAAAPAEGWRRWAADLGHYDKDRVAGFGGVLIAGGLIGIVLLYLFVLLADEVLGQETAALDAAAYALVQRFSSPEMDVAARAISFIGSEAVWILNVILLGLFLWQRRWGAAVMLILVSGGAQLLNDVLKSTFHRARPAQVVGLIAAQQYSFPSGHAMVSAAFYFYLAYLCWRLVRGVWRFVLIAGLVVLVLLIGASRIYLQGHYLSDVIAGYIAGFVWADAVIVGSQLLVTRGLPRLSRPPNEASTYAKWVKPLVLIIRDGWGVCDEDAESAKRHGNAVLVAKLPVLDRLLKTYPHALLQASGEAVGLPPGQMGNSEVGHQNLGAGRVTYQDLMRISLAIRDESFFQNPVLLKVFGEVRRSGKRLHLMGLLSDGGVHSHISHLFALLEMARRQRLAPDQVVVHPILDGRDTPPRSGEAYLEQLEQELHRLGVGRIGTVSGRYYSMDRDNRWERTERAYAAYVRGEGRRAASARAAIQSSYAADKGDEFVEPTVIVGADGQPLGTVQDGDAIVFFNFRPDRARQITRAFTRAAPEGVGQPTVDVHFVCLTEYDPTLRAPVAFPPQLVENPLGEVVAQAGLRQLRIAETEKYAHVTYFFNGGREVDFANEDRALIPSPKVATYDLQPEMSADGITDELLRRLSGAESPYDLVVLNFANADMVGHTGMLDATIAALEVVDACIGRIVERVRELGGTVMITADHGNAEQMIDDDGGPLTAHTLNPVHLLLVDDRLRDATLHDGIFADVAPTILGLLGLAVPAEMTGHNLLKVV